MVHKYTYNLTDVRNSIMGHGSFFAPNGINSMWRLAKRHEDDKVEGQPILYIVNHHTRAIFIYDPSIETWLRSESIDPDLEDLVDCDKIITLSDVDMGRVIEVGSYVELCKRRLTRP